MLIRVRSNVGVWRVEGLEPSSTGQDVLNGIAMTRAHVVYEKPLSKDPSCNEPLDLTMSLQNQGLGHGSMVHCRVDPASCADALVVGRAAASDSEAPHSGADNAWTENTSNVKRVIDKDGSIRLVPSNARSAGDDKGFRRGMLPLRDIKMAWTLNEFVEMDSQFTFKIQRQEQAICKQVSLDTASVNDFQTYLQRFQFARKRFAFLYGKYITTDEGEKKTIVEAIYEPPQQPDPDVAEGFEQLDDPLEEKVEALATMLGLEKVGWIVGGAKKELDPGEEDYVLTSAEVIMAAELQLEAAGGVEETPFVTVKVSQGDAGVSVEAFQVSQQCMSMVAEEALEIGANHGSCVVNETFTAIQEGKESKTVNNNFFLTVVPIIQHQSDTLVAQFPKMNRDLDDRMPSKNELKQQLSKSGSSGWNFLDLLSDFNLLVYLTEFLDINADFPKICQSVVDRDIPLDDGYKIIIASIAGLEGAY
ncbi:NPL4 family protein [Nitzschia inconspicua]|uniref:NPL4 family protein n=1 Tax=Nitzschia inconspicua TaxID=303405 RepID=A0A9K3LAD2_9STRA|nr:NPL4 family protein [Nitzschia inconspicua]